MAEAKIEQIVDKLFTPFEEVARELASPAIPRIQSLLAERGTPLSPEQLATALGAESPPAIEELPAAEADEDGNLVTIAGLTLRTTPHRFEVEGKTLYTFCALDALLFPYAFIGKPAKIESLCPVSGTPVRVVIEPDRLGEVDPPEASVSVVTPDRIERLREIRGAFCEMVNFFSSAEAASQWLQGVTESYVLSTQEAFHLGRAMVDRLWELRTA